MENTLYTISYIIKNGTNFEDLWFSSTSDEVLDDAEDEGGQPFTGIAYEMYDTKNIVYFCHYKSGFKHGPYRQFYESGNLKSEEIMEYGQTKSFRKIWFEDGKLQSLGEYEYGIELSYREWNPERQLIASKDIDKDGDMYELLTVRRENA